MLIYLALKYFFSPEDAAEARRGAERRRRTFNWWQFIYMCKKTVDTVFQPLVVNVFVTKHLRVSRLTGWYGKHDLRQKRSKSKFSFSPYWGFVREAPHPIFGPQVISSVWRNKCPLEMICKYPLRCCKPTIKTTITITQGLSWMEIISKYPSRCSKHRLFHVTIS